MTAAKKKIDGRVDRVVDSGLVVNGIYYRKDKISISVVGNQEEEYDMMAPDTEDTKSAPKYKPRKRKDTKVIGVIGSSEEEEDIPLPKKGKRS